MSTQATDADLMRILKFDAQDLAANRQGSMSSKQRLWLLMDNTEVFLIMLFILGTPIMAVSMIMSRGILIDQILAAAAVIVVAIFSGQTQLKKLWEAILGQVSLVTGIVKFQVQVYTPFQNAFLAMVGEKWAYGVIEKVTFHVPLEMAEKFEGKKLRVYYTPKLRRALSAEVVE